VLWSGRGTFGARLMAKIAVITGGAGFIGSHLARALLGEGWEVRIVDDFSTGTRANVANGAVVVEGDIRSADVVAPACEGADVVFHLAARVSIRQSVETFCEDADTNLMGTLNVLRSAAAAGVGRIVFASSMAVYADGEAGTPIDEGHSTTPISPYGIAKLAAERYLLLLGPSLGIEPVVLRFFNTYGTGQGYTPYVGVLTIFATRILADEPCTIYGDGRQCRDFTHVEDIVRGCLLASLKAGAAGGIFNLGSGRGTTVVELGELIRRRLGRGEFQHVERDPSELVYSVADIGKASRVLGYRPRGRLVDRIGEVIDSIAESIQRSPVSREDG